MLIVLHNQVPVFSSHAMNKNTWFISFTFLWNCREGNHNTILVTIKRYNSSVLEKYITVLSLVPFSMEVIFICGNFRKKRLGRWLMCNIQTKNKLEHRSTYKNVHPSLKETWTRLNGRSNQKPGTNNHIMNPLLQQAGRKKWSLLGWHAEDIYSSSIR